MQTAFGHIIPFVPKEKEVKELHAMNALSPVSFKEANTNLKPALRRRKHKGLSVHTDGVVCVSCWKVSFFQRLCILFLGRIWLGVRSGYSMPPVWLDCGRTVFLKGKKGDARG